MSTSLHKPHRKMWHNHHGKIPIDENGISYEIHHINGDHNDNRLENLMCVSIADHYEIHHSQGDTYACAAILRRIKHNHDVFAQKQSNLVLSGDKHPMFGKTHSLESRAKISKNHHDVSGTNNPMFGKFHAEESRKKMSQSKLGQGKGVPKSEETKKRMSESVVINTCPHCGKSARGNSMKRWHFDKCKLKGTVL